jgi:phosphate transport system protein
MGTDGHIDRDYDQRIERMHRHLVEFGADLDSLVSIAGEVAFADDATLRERVRMEAEICERRERDLDRECLVLLATRSPVASDLVEITSAMRLASELGRIAELVRALCSPSVEGAAAVFEDDEEEILAMLRIVRTMVKDVISAHAARSAGPIAQVAAAETEIDRRFNTLFERTIDRMTADSERVRTGVLVQSISKRVERMADHAARAGETVLGLLNGDSRTAP